MQTDTVRHKVTLDQVAELAGVSKASASKALNNRKDVAASTRAKVFAACEKLGYVRSAPAMSSSLRPRICLLADNLLTTYTLEVLKGASTEAMRQGIDLSIAHLDTPENAAIAPKPLSKEWFIQLRQDHFIGVITLTTPLSKDVLLEVQKSGLSHVAIDPANTPPTDTASIGATNWNGGFDATEHLISLGHRRIGFIQGSPASVPSQERFEGYLSALRKNGIPVNPDFIGGNDFTYENGREAATWILSLPPQERPTAIFACNDTAAIGVYEAARQRGLRVPEDLSVVGFDNSTLALWSTPRLTTVHQPLQEMGSNAVRTLMHLSSSEVDEAPNPIKLATTLVIRDSTAQPPQDS